MFWELFLQSSWCFWCFHAPAFMIIMVVRLKRNVPFLLQNPNPYFMMKRKRLSICIEEAYGNGWCLSNIQYRVFLVQQDDRGNNTYCTSALASSRGTWLLWFTIQYWICLLQWQRCGSWPEEKLYITGRKQLSMGEITRKRKSNVIFISSLYLQSKAPPLYYECTLIEHNPEQNTSYIKYNIYLLL